MLKPSPLSRSQKSAAWGWIGTRPKCVYFVPARSQTCCLGRPSDCLMCGPILRIGTLSRWSTSLATATTRPVCRRRTATDRHRTGGSTQTHRAKNTERRAPTRSASAILAARIRALTRRARCGTGETVARTSRGSAAYQLLSTRRLSTGRAVTAKRP